MGYVVLVQWFIVKDASKFFKPNIVNLFSWHSNPWITNQYIKKNLPSVPPAVLSDCRRTCVIFGQTCGFGVCCGLQVPSDPHKNVGVTSHAPCLCTSYVRTCCYCCMICCSDRKMDMCIETKSGNMRCTFPGHRSYIVIDGVEYGKVVAPMDSE